MIIKEQELKDLICSTVIELVEPVESTMGVDGSNVGLLNNINSPVIINDGVRVANSVKFEDKGKKFISDIVKRVAKETDEIVGDCTTTSLVLLKGILEYAYNEVDFDSNYKDIIKGIDIATRKLISYIEKNSIKLDADLSLKLATITSNNDEELGKMISDVFSKVGKSGKVDFEVSNIDKTYFDIVEGSRYEKGMVSPLFATDLKGTAYIEESYVILIKDKLHSIKPIVNILNKIHGSEKGLLIIADDFSKESIEDLTHNKLKNNLKVVAIDSPGYGIVKTNYLNDLEFLTGAESVSYAELDNFTIESLGTVKELKVTSEDFIFKTDKTKEELEEYTKPILEKEANTKTEKEELETRVSTILQSMATIYVGGSSKTEVHEKVLRVEDCVSSMKVSLDGGVLPGGGSFFYKYYLENIENTTDVGEQILLGSLRKPIFQLCLNSQLNTYSVLENIENNIDKPNYGLNLKSGKFGNLLEEGVVDTAKGMKTALENASSVAQSLLNMKYLVL